MLHGHGLMENRHGLLVDACLIFADGHAERAAALHMIEPQHNREPGHFSMETPTQFAWNPQPHDASSLRSFCGRRGKTALGSRSITV